MKTNVDLMNEALNEAHDNFQSEIKKEEEIVIEQFTEFLQSLEVSCLTKNVVFGAIIEF
ncbi:MAG: hypothetical protein R6U95_06055 [Bacteroidales bacterium]